MKVTLSNERYQVEIQEKGAELSSFFDKKTEIEYVWQADPKFWARHSPILFPHVGQVKNNTLTIHGKEYASSQHGFARDMNFTLISQSETKASFELTENDISLARYPYKFRLVLSYELRGESLEVFWQVENKNDETLYFGIGGHPAFNVPLEDGLNFEDYYFEVSPKQSRTRIPFVPPMLDVKNAYQEEVAQIAITRELFHNDALVYETKGKTEITLKSDKSPHSLTMSYDNIPYVGLWSMYPTEAPFVCIEPWWSFADTPEDSGEFSTKHSVQSLKVGEIFKTSYVLTVR